jgi:hypothetical protein
MMIPSAVNLANAGKVDAGRKLCEQLATSVSVPAVYTNRAALEAEKGDFEASRQAVQQALAKDPTYEPAREKSKASHPA